MSTKPHSVTLICSSADRDLVDRLSRALGYAPNNSNPPARTMVAMLSESGSTPATHYAAHSRADGQFVWLFTEASGGDVPVQPRPGHAWADYGLTLADVIALLPRITVRVKENVTGAESWLPAISELGLQRLDDGAGLEP